MGWLGLGSIEAFYWQYPWWLFLLLLLPLLWLLYFRTQSQRLRHGFAFSPLLMVQQMKGHSRWWASMTSLTPPVFGSIILVALVFAMAQPILKVRQAVSTVDMMLVMDISISMMATDMEPNRLDAAKKAAMTFVRNLPDDVRIGLEYFAGEVIVKESPTRDHERLVSHLQDLKLEDLKTNTAIGSAIQASLGVFRDLDSQGQSDPTGQGLSSGEDSSTNDDGGPSSGSGSGGYGPSKGQNQEGPERIVVLMSDGDSYAGYPWFVAAENAQRQGVKIHTIGVGSDMPTEIVYQGNTYPVFFNEGTLKTIADRTGGTFFRVFKESDFKTVYESVHQKSIRYERQQWNLSPFAAGVGFAVWLLGFLILYCGGDRRLTP